MITSSPLPTDTLNYKFKSRKFWASEASRYHSDLHHKHTATGTEIDYDFAIFNSTTKPILKDNMMKYLFCHPAAWHDSSFTFFSFFIGWFFVPIILPMKLFIFFVKLCYIILNISDRKFLTKLSTTTPNLRSKCIQFCCKTLTHILLKFKFDYLPKVELNGSMIRYPHQYVSPRRSEFFSKNVDDSPIYLVVGELIEIFKHLIECCAIFTLQFNYLISFFLINSMAYTICKIMQDYNEFCEHFGCLPGDIMTETTSCYNNIFNFIFFNEGYHDEHHLSQGCHWAELHRLRKRMTGKRRIVPYCMFLNPFLPLTWSFKEYELALNRYQKNVS